MGNDVVEEKREYRRYQIFFPVTLRIGEEEIVGVCRDVSAGGVLIADLEARSTK